ncbi:MAG: glycosyltransferase, partial [Candidatus Moranbacteria bacterium]|nr:glycosyltransferase [Candidatus Moranbacteria bacterium]
MIIGIDASRAFQKNKTGIEEYSFQVIKHLRDLLKDEPSFAKASEGKQVVLYCNPATNIKPDFSLPENWRVKNLRAPIFWTQARLSTEMIFHPVDVLFISAHTVPIIHPARNASRLQKILIWAFSHLYLLSEEAIKMHSDAGGPKNTVVTIHGLEYEFCPKAYSFWQRFYMRFVIKNSCRWAKTIIAVSENTKSDLISKYNVDEKKIKVIYEGYSEYNFQFPNPNFQQNSKSQIKNTKYQILNTRYLLFVGRLEERKNIIGIVRAFE